MFRFLAVLSFGAAAFCFFVPRIGDHLAFGFVALGVGLYLAEAFEGKVIRR